MIVGSGIWRMTYLTVFDWAWINAIILNTCRYIFRVNVQERIFLALLDYVRRAHEIEIRPSSVCFFDLSLTFLYGFLSNFSCGFPRRFLNFWKKNFFLICLHIFFVFVNMGPHGSKNVKTLLLQIAAKSFETVFSSQSSSQNYVWEFCNFEFLIFNIFFLKFQIHHCSLWRNQKTQLSGKWAIVHQNGVKCGTRGYSSTYIGYLWPFSV